MRRSEMYKYVLKPDQIDLLFSGEFPNGIPFTIEGNQLSKILGLKKTASLDKRIKTGSLPTPSRLPDSKKLFWFTRDLIQFLKNRSSQISKENSHD